MNIHPIFVHFPVAFLTLYAVLEILRFKVLLKQSFWFYLKAVLVIVGVLGAAAALATGDLASEILLKQHRELHDLVEMHETFAGLTFVTFLVLASGYAILWVKQYNFAWLSRENFIGKAWKVKMYFGHLIAETPLVWILALVGLVSITITGALGGSIVYGHLGDPFTSFVYNLFFK